MNPNPGLELKGHGGHTPEVKAQKGGAPSDTEDLEHLNKRLHHTSHFRELLKAEEDRERLAQFNYQKADQDPSVVKRMRLSMSRGFGRSDSASIVP